MHKEKLVLLIQKQILQPSPKLAQVWTTEACQCPLKQVEQVKHGTTAQICITKRGDWQLKASDGAKLWYITAVCVLQMQYLVWEKDWSDHACKAPLQFEWENNVVVLSTENKLQVHVWQNR